MLYRDTQESSPIIAPSLFVEDGKTVTLSSVREIATTFIRPRHIYALKTLAGIPTRKPARLSDTSAFERMDTLGDCVDLQAMNKENRIGGHSASFLRGIVSALDPEQPMPDRVKWESTMTKECGCRETQQGRKMADMATDIQSRSFSPELKYTSGFEVPIPSFLKNFTVAVKMLSLADIAVGYRSTFVIDGNTAAMTVRNFLAYEESRILQRDSNLIIDIVGTLRGGISRFAQVVKRDTTSMKVDWEMLAKRAHRQPLKGLNNAYRNRLDNER